MPEYHYFGRKVAVDLRDAAFPMRLALDPLREMYFPRGLPPGVRHYWSGPILDQGKTGTCVAHGWRAKISAAPIMQSMSLAPYDFYRRIVSVDEWSDNDWEATAADEHLQSGTSVRAGAKVLVDLGYAKHYLWAESAEDARAWILAGFGGVTIGVNWLSGMMSTDTSGFIAVTGSAVGGHCVYLNGFSDRAKRGGKPVRAFRGMNSWGRTWGQNGRFWITYEDLERSLVDGGEACALTELRAS